MCHGGLVYQSYLAIPATSTHLPKATWLSLNQSYLAIPQPKLPGYPSANATCLYQPPVPFNLTLPGYPLTKSYLAIPATSINLKIPGYHSTKSYLAFLATSTPQPKATWLS